MRFELLKCLPRAIRSVTTAAMPVCALCAGVAIAAYGQLNENCVVSILNRSTQVRPNGTWVVPNIPAGFGPVRARATCLQNGVTRSGQSAFFVIPPNGSVDVPPIVLGAVTPVPTGINVTASVAVLTQAGATTQLTVTADYAGGTTADVTGPNTGTTYRSSNQMIATASANGLVTARTSGNAVIQATNEGRSGFISIAVVLSADSDGDGIPDDVELKFGLNPNNSVDALEDLDRDGLSNRDEYTRGTDLRNRDTDGDGILDGEEVIAGADGFITNPLLADSDGDGVRDGLEIATGSDPNNPASVNLQRALTRLSVSPNAFILTVNSLTSQASRQLAVTGHLSDGQTVDLTSTLRGTNYSSSDLNVCNFGSPDGRVFAGGNGSCTITVTNRGFSATAAGQVRSFSPTAISYVSIPGFANNVDVKGNYAYVAAGATGLQVVDVSDRANPRIVASRDTPGNANDVFIAGDFAYVADGVSGLQIINIANPLAPTIASSFDTPGEAFDVVVRANRAYVADGSGGLQIIDVATPTSPRLLGALAGGGQYFKGVDVDASRFIAVAVGGGSLSIINVANPSAPAPMAGGAIGGISDPRDVALNGNVAYIADYNSGFVTIDITSPGNPIGRGAIPRDTGGLLFDVAVLGSFAFGADVFFVNGVPIIDISTPGTPLPRAILDFRNFQDDDGTGIAVDGTHIYLTASRGIIEHGSFGDTRLYIGQYAQGSVSVSGRVLRADGSTPAAGINVSAGATLSGVTGPDGSYAFAGLPPGMITIDAADAGTGDRGRASLQADDGDTVTLNVTMIGVGRVQVSVREGLGAPIAGAPVTISGQRPTGAFNLTATTAGDGTATVDRVLAGAFTAAVSVFGMTQNLPGTVAPGGTANVAFVFVTGGTISGTLRAPDGVTPAGGFQVRVLNSAGATVRQLTTPSDGTYQLPAWPLAPTRWRLSMLPAV